MISMVRKPSDAEPYLKQMFDNIVKLEMEES